MIALVILCIVIAFRTYDEFYTDKMLNKKMKKNFLQSKINWGGMIIIALAVQDMITKWGDTPFTWQNISTAVIGIGIIAIRTFTVQKPIGTNEPN